MRVQKAPLQVFISRTPIGTKKIIVQILSNEKIYFVVKNVLFVIKKHPRAKWYELMTYNIIA